MLHTEIGGARRDFRVTRIRDGTESLMKKDDEATDDRSESA